MVNTIKECPVCCNDPCSCDYIPPERDQSCWNCKYRTQGRCNIWNQFIGCYYDGWKVCREKCGEWAYIGFENDTTEATNVC